MDLLSSACGEMIELASLCLKKKEGKKKRLR